jgi:hypothetical protein
LRLDSALCAGLAPLPTERDRRRVFPLILGARRILGNLTGGDLHHAHGITDHVGRAFLAFWSFGHVRSA